MKQLAFTVGCFILPKYMMKAYEATIPLNEADVMILPEKISKYFEEVLDELYQGLPHEEYGISHDFFHVLA